MTITRTRKRHPASPAESLLTTRAEIIAFAQFISHDRIFCTAVLDTLEEIAREDNQRRAEAALLAEMKRRSDLPGWRRWLERTWRNW